MIPAGRSGKLIAKVHTKSTQSATLKKSISVFTDSSGDRSIHLTMEFTVEPEITIRPRPQLYLSSIVGTPLSTRLLFHRNDGKKLEIKEIRFDEPSLQLKAQAVDLKAEAPAGFQPKEGDVWLLAQLEKGAKPGIRNTKVWITTNHPKLGEIEIPVNIRIKPLIGARPSEIRLWIENDKLRSPATMLRLSHNGGKLFGISSIEVADPAIFAASVVDPTPSRVFSIKVELLKGIKPDEVKKGLQSKLIIHTTDPAQPLVTVPIRLIRREAITRPSSRPLKLNAKPAFGYRPLPAGTPRPYPTGTPSPR